VAAPRTTQRLRRHEAPQGHLVAPRLDIVGLARRLLGVSAEWHDSWLVISISLVATAAGWGLVGWMLIKELARVRHGGEMLTTQVLGILLVMLRDSCGQWGSGTDVTGRSSGS
jgi:hypothetical protein